MSLFGSASRLAAWAGVCPGNDESAGKRRSGRTTAGNVYLKTALGEAVHAASRAKGGYLRDKFYRLKNRHGHKRAAMAIAHKVLIAVYHILSGGTSYNDLGDAYLDQLSNRHLTHSLPRRLERLGYQVTIQPRAA
jgi:transposase